jgi:glutathione S-transferase
MEPVLLYGVPQGCSFGSIVALEWLNQPYRLCRINMLEDLQTDEYARINADRQTPVLLLENGAILTQSVAILHNIATRGIGQGLGFQQGTLEFDRLNQRLSFLTTTFFSAFAPLWHAYKMEENPPVQTMLRELGRGLVAKAHARLDAMLANQEWLVGNQRTVADAYFVGVARWANYHRAIKQSDYPNVLRLFEKLEADPAVAFAHAIEDQRPAKSAGGFLGHVPLEELQARR